MKGMAFLCPSPNLVTGLQIVTRRISASIPFNSQVTLRFSIRVIVPLTSTQVWRAQIKEVDIAWCKEGIRAVFFLSGHAGEYCHPGG